MPCVYASCERIAWRALVSELASTSHLKVKSRIFPSLLVMALSPASASSELGAAHAAREVERARRASGRRGLRSMVPPRAASPAPVCRHRTTLELAIRQAEIVEDYRNCL